MEKEQLQEQEYNSINKSYYTIYMLYVHVDHQTTNSGFDNVDI